MQWPLLEDMSADGLLLTNRSTGDPLVVTNRSTTEAEIHRPLLHPYLSLWDIARRKEVEGIPFDLPELPERAAGRFRDHLPRPFKFLPGSTRVIGLQEPYLVLIDLQKKAVVRHVLASDDLLDPRSPYLRVTQYVEFKYTMFAINPQDGSIAAASNLGAEPRVFLFGPDLQGPIRSWSLPRYAQDLCWSPDGKRLAVLYSGLFNQKKELVVDLQYLRRRDFLASVRLPDVSIFDPLTGQELLKFSTNDIDAKIRFNLDGSLIYCVSSTESGEPWKKHSIRAFSASTGSLMQTITAPGSGVRNNFALSPDGRFIVADASREVPHPFFTEGSGWQKIGGFVLFDAKTGDLLFENDKKMAGETWDPMRFAFSPDGRLLFVDPNYSGWRGGEQIDVYSLEALY